MGRFVDLITASKYWVGQSKFNIDMQRTIVLYKTAIYSCYFPVALALLFCGFPVERGTSRIRTATSSRLTSSRLSESTSRSRTTTSTFRGAWVTREDRGRHGQQVLKYANPTWRAVLDADCGRKDSEAEAQVKEIFRQHRLDRHSGAYEDKACDRINTPIDKVPEMTSPCGEAVLRCAVFDTSSEKTYKRTK